MLASRHRPPDRVETYLPEPDTTPEIVEEQMIELASSPNHVVLTSSLSSSSDGQLGTSVESSSDKALRKLLAKLVRDGYRIERMWEASRHSMQQFDKEGVTALGYSRVSFSSLHIEPRSDTMRYCVYNRVSDDICTGAPLFVIACRGTAVAPIRPPPPAQGKMWAIPVLEYSYGCCTPNRNEASPRAMRASHTSPKS